MSKRASSPRLRIGIVGCGEAAQIMHLPSLRFLSDLFQVTAVCDLSRTVAEQVGREGDVPLRLVDHAETVALDEVDAVLVATPDAHHSEVALAAIAAGKHVLVEKPLCMTLLEADEITTAQKREGVVVQVGYMRRYAPAFLETVTAVKELGVIKLAHVQHVLGINRLVVEPTSRVVTGGDIPDTALAEGRNLRLSLLAEATGDAPREIQEAYSLLLSLASHDLSAMRELLGRPEKILYAASWHDAWYVTAAFDYGSFVCHFAAGFDRIPRVDATIAVYGERRVVQVRFDTSHVRNLPVRATVTDANLTGGVEERTIHPGWRDPFVEEWRAFHAHATGGTQPKTSPADFREDLELFRELAAAMAVRR
ncbi:MAG: Gfo/Idh/MocA family protein [Gaiellaceae bacterium]